MTTHEIGRQRRFLRHMVALLCATGLCITVGSLSLSWKRAQVTASLRHVGQLETQVRQEQERIRHLDVRIAELHQPAYLERQVKALALDLRPRHSSDIVYLDSGADARLEGSLYAMRQETEAETLPQRGLGRRGFDIAVLENLRAIE